MVGEQLVLVARIEPAHRSEWRDAKRTGPRAINACCLTSASADTFVWEQDFPRTASLKIKRDMLAEEIGRQLDRSAVQPL